MVALKLQMDSHLGQDQEGKQERRGGIETQGDGLAHAICLGKQERRGGIETVDGRTDPGRHHREAGTPWWH